MTGSQKFKTVMERRENLKLKPQVGSLYGSCVAFKYIGCNWGLGHNKHKVGQKKEQCLRFILIVSSLLTYVAEFWR